MGTTYTQQATYKFMSLNMGQLLPRRAFTPIPLTTDVKNRVEQMARQQGRPKRITFQDRLGVEEEPTGMEEDLQPIMDAVDEINDRAPGLLEDDQEVPALGRQPPNEEPVLDGEVKPEEEVPVLGEDEQVDEEPVLGNPEEQEEVPYVTRAGRVVRRPKRLIPTMEGQTYQHVCFLQETVEYEPEFVDAFKHIVNHHVFTQYGLKKGLQKFGDAGRQAVHNETEQLHLRSCFEPLDPNNMTYEEKKKALESLIFVKQKETGEVKARHCADGRPQREYTPKEEAASPAVSLESIMITCTIDAMEERDTAIIDVPNAFPHTPMPNDEKVVMKIRGELAELLVTISPALY